MLRTWLTVLYFGQVLGAAEFHGTLAQCRALEKPELIARLENAGFEFRRPDDFAIACERLRDRPKIGERR